MLSKKSLDEIKQELAEALKPFVRYEGVILADGSESSYYIDVKESFGDAKIKKLMVEGLRRQMSPEIGVVAGMGNGGTPLADTMSTMYEQLRFTMVRDREKKHGLGGWLDAYKPVIGDKVAFLEDVGNSGGSSLIAANRIKEATGVEVKSFHIVVKRGNLEMLSGRAVTYLLTVSDVVDPNRLIGKRA